ncbi:MAG TPA: enoyl-CoA hydratase-related protein [Bacteroidia bacterium]|nr:enoyl-CoA hydratase-related protein [Bacteroidia bacterium]
MNPYQNLKTSIENGICTVTINRPDKMNALNRATVQEIGEAIKEANANKEVFSIIITGEGLKAFAAGADIKEFLGLSNEQGMAMAKAGQDVFQSIENSPKPVIAAVNGFALGGGCELAMACHLRVASENAKFGQPEVNLGLIPGYGGTQRLIRYIGRGKALEFMMTAEMLNAHKALELGLVNYVVPLEALHSKCVEILNEIKTKSPFAIGAVIRAANAYDETSKGFEAELTEFGKCFASEEIKEGINAFLEKRKPDFHTKHTQTV